MPSGNGTATFIPAQSEAEAVARIFALTGASATGTRGEKRALVALRDALRLDVEIAETNAALGSALATKLDVVWLPDQHTQRSAVNLTGLNALLAGAARAYEQGSLARLRSDAPPNLSGPEWADFQPARSKIEAVTRIAALTNSPKEWLGPGGKEHKSVLLNLADALMPARPLDRSSKTRLGASLSAEFGVPWTDACGSTGETISLLGLNTILAGAERYLDRLGVQMSDLLRTPEDEGDALAAALVAGLPQHWEGRSAIEWLMAQHLRGANDNEWQGFYGEARAKQVLHASFTPRMEPPQARYGNTIFDYALNWVWDIKVHTEESTGTRARADTMMLNDEQAVRDCVADHGLGFLVIGGVAHKDLDGSFLAWHRSMKGAAGLTSAASNSGRSRVRKRAFDPTRVEAFWIRDALALQSAIAAGQLLSRAQGRQAPRAGETSGAPRRPKLHMQVASARTHLRVSEHRWAT